MAGDCGSSLAFQCLRWSVCETKTFDVGVCVVVACFYKEFDRKEFIKLCVLAESIWYWWFLEQNEESVVVFIVEKSF